MLVVVTYDKRMRAVWQVIKRDGTVLCSFETRAEALAEHERLSNAKQ